MSPYIGITGFSKPEEVFSALEVFPKGISRKLMVGVLASYRSLRGIPMKPRWAKRMPDPTTISRLFLNDERVVNLIHLSTEEETVLEDMLKIHSLAGQNFHGFQLNIAWPQINQLISYRAAVGRGYRIVLQIGQKAMEAVGGTIQDTANKLSHYVGVIDDILFDPSGGQGKPFDTRQAYKFLSVITDKGWNIGLGVAGGLGPDSLNLVEPLIAKFPNLSIDAEGRLRNNQNDLDLKAMSDYLAKALQLFA